MSTPEAKRAKSQIEYPDSDGQPIADNTLQFRWIQTLHGGLDAMFRRDPEVFVAGDLLWYPVEGNNRLRTAPDVMVALGRPKGDRGSYRQWEEGGVAPQVTFEILSHKNRAADRLEKLRFYDRYGVEEFYVYDPQTARLEGWLRRGERLERIPQMDGWVSPRLKIRFDLSAGELRVFLPDGQRLISYIELAELRDQERRRADEEHRRADEEHRRAEEVHPPAQEDRTRPDQEHGRAEEEYRQFQENRRRVEHLRAQIRALGLEPDV